MQIIEKARVRAQTVRPFWRSKSQVRTMWPGVALSALLMVPLTTAGLAALERAEIGNATKVVRDVFGVLDEGAADRDIELQASVYHDESIRTEVESATTLTFRDDTMISLGPNSNITLDDFVYDPNPSLSAFAMSTVQGILRFATGSLPKEAYTITTPAATIGVRGTTFAVAVQPPLDPVLRQCPWDSVTVMLESVGEIQIVDCVGRVYVLDTPGETLSIPSLPDCTCGPADEGTQQAMLSAVALLECTLAGTCLAPGLGGPPEEIAEVLPGPTDVVEPTSATDQ